MSSDSDLEIAFFVPDDFPYSDVLSVCQQLEDAGICVPGYIPPKVGLYHPHGYLYARQTLQKKTIILPDRNIASRIAQLAKGYSTKKDEQLRTVASLLGFAQCLDIQFEPSIAFHELAHKNGNSEALTELSLFRAADKTSPHAILDIALGRADQLQEQCSPQQLEDSDLAKPLIRWNRNYIIVLKMIELERTPLSHLDRILFLLSWMKNEFIFGVPAALLASIYFAPNSPPRRGLLKNQNSLNRESAVAGAKNAAWDITHLSDWLRLINLPENRDTTRFLFASLDKNLLKIAGILIGIFTAPSMSDQISSDLRSWWSESESAEIAKFINAQIEYLTAKDWSTDMKSVAGLVDGLIAAGEMSIRSYKLPH